MSANLDFSNEYTGGLTTKQALERLNRDIDEQLLEIKPHIDRIKSWRFIVPQMLSLSNVHSTFKLFSIVCLSVSIITYFFAFLYGHFNSTLPLLIEALLLLVVLIVNFLITFWNVRSRFLELYNKARRICDSILECSNNNDLVNLWKKGTFYPSLNTPTSPCINLQWTYRDGQLVNLPLPLLVTGDVIQLNPGRRSPAKCRRIQSINRRPKRLSDLSFHNMNVELTEENLYEMSHTYSYHFDDNPKGSSYNRGEMYAPNVDHAPKSFTLPRLRKASKPTKFLVLETPIAHDIKEIILANLKPPPPSAFDKELRLIFVRNIEYLFVPVVYSLAFVFSVFHYWYVEFTGREPADAGAGAIVLMFLRPCMAIIPLIPLSLPILWTVLNIYGLIKVNSIFDAFMNLEKVKRNKQKENQSSVLKQPYSFEDVDLSSLTEQLNARKISFTKMCKEIVPFIMNRSESLWRTSNLLHVMGSITAFCCVDKKGILSWPNPTADKVFFLTNKDTPEATNNQPVVDDAEIEINDKCLDVTPQKKSRRQKKMSMSNSAPKTDFVQLDITHDQNCAYGLQFDDIGWTRYLNSLKPLGLAVLLNTCNQACQSEFVQFCDHIAAESLKNEAAIPVASKRCLCELASYIGFKPSATKDYEYCYQVALFRHVRPELIQKGKLAKSLNFSRLKMPFSNMTCAVFRDDFSKGTQMFTQGTGDLILDTCAEYWNGKTLAVLTDYERKKILDFYQRSSLTSYCCAFAYLPLVNETHVQHNNLKCLNDFYIELPPDSSHLFPFQRTLETNFRNLALDSHNLTSSSDHLESKDISSLFLKPNEKMLNQYLSSDSLGRLEERSTPKSDDDPKLDIRLRKFSVDVDARRKQMDFELSKNSLEQTVRNVINEIFLGMITLQYQACPDFIRLIELLENGCIRFVHFSKENEVRSRVFSEKMGLESGWNCHISLLNEDDSKESDSEKDKKKISEPSSDSDSSDSSDYEGNRPMQHVEAIRLKQQQRRKHPSFSSDRSESVLSSGTNKHKTIRSGSKISGIISNIGRNMSRSPSHVTTASTTTEHTDPIGFDMSNRAKLPKGINNIRPHIENVDNVPLLVSLFTDCTPETTMEMIQIMQEYDEVVCAVGSMSNISNMKIFKQADASIGVSPMDPHVCMMDELNRISPEKDLPPNFVSPFDLGNSLIALPCSFTMPRLNAIIFYELIMNSRDYMMRMRNLFQFFLCSSLSLSIAQMITSLIFLPPFLSPGVVLWLSLILLPVLSVSLMGTEPDPSVMTVATGKKLHLKKETLTYFFFCYVIKFIPSILVCIVIFAVIIGTSCGHSKVGKDTVGPCWMFSDVKADGDIRGDILWSSHLLIGQTITSMFFVLYIILVSMNFVHRNHLLWERNPFRNTSWASSAVALLFSHFFVCVIEIYFYVNDFEDVFDFLGMIPIYVWIGGVFWPVLLVSINVYTKRREIKMYARQQRRARLDFNTKLGMNSPF